MNKDLTFEKLVSSIKQVHEELAAHAAKAVNISLTLRNWIIGCYIYEYEQGGADRAEYGEHLFVRLSNNLKEQKVAIYHPRELRRCRAFYIFYPQIRETLSPQFGKLISELFLDSKKEIRGTASPKLTVSADKLVKNLSFSHFAELTAIDDSLKRTFYEIECIRSNWSIRELKRQINSLYYERSGLSKDKNKLAELAHFKAEPQEPKLAIRDPYIFEFLCLKPKEVMDESNLESLLLDKLQEFLLEMGHGFCFETRQKRILINDTHYFVDLVFYHRILKCHVLVDIKLDEFNHENIGQLNTYVNWYKKNMTATGDNPPIGILLCTKKKHMLVEYALAGMDNQLFVSKYQLELPKKEDMQKFIEAEIREVKE